MELKDVILSTLAEMEEEVNVEPANSVKDFTPSTPTQSQPQEVQEVQEVTEVQHNEPKPQEESQSVASELQFLQAIRERLLVLFEGFQSPNNTNIEAKVDMTLNFLEYTLATIDDRVEKLEKGKDV
jgi:hypothetical protein